MGSEQLWPAEIGPYRILRRLGQGGMGEVYEALHKSIERRVALKVLKPRYAADPELMSRFFNEARAVNLIEHPGIVQVSDYGRKDDGTAYIVMEYLRGETLGTRLARCGGRLPVSEAVRLSRQIAGALLAAHEKGIVHRDMKPDNVMLIESPDPEAAGRDLVKILDFGIAKLAGTLGEAQPGTRTGLVMGTPLYMSPEQCRGAKQVDALTDVYSLGVMLYRMLSGEYPLYSEEEGQILAMQIYESPRPLLEVAPHVDGGLAQLVHRMLCKDRASRIAMADVIASLDRWLAESHGRGERAGSAAGPQTSAGASAEATAPGESSAPAERALGQATAVTESADHATLPRSSASGDRSTVQHLDATLANRPQPRDSAVGAGRPPSKEAVSTLAAELKSTRRRNARWLALLSLGLASGLWAGQYLRSQPPVTRSVVTGPQPAQPAGLAEATAADSTPPAPSVVRLPDAGASRPETPELVLLSVRSEPSGALVIRPRDGVVLGRTPFRDASAAHPDRVALLLRLPHHRDKRIELPGRKSSDVLVRLESESLPRVPVRPPAARRRADQPSGDEPEILE